MEGNDVGSSFLVEGRVNVRVEVFSKGVDFKGGMGTRLFEDGRGEWG